MYCICYHFLYISIHLVLNATALFVSTHYRHPSLSSLLLLTTMIPFVGFAVRGSGDVMCFPLTSHQVTSKVPGSQTDSQLIPARYYNSNTPTQDIIIPCALCQHLDQSVTVSIQCGVHASFDRLPSYTLSVTELKKLQRVFIHTETRLRYSG